MTDDAQSYMALDLHIQGLKPEWTGSAHLDSFKNKTARNLNR